MISTASLHILTHTHPKPKLPLKPQVPNPGPGVPLVMFLLRTQETQPINLLMSLSWVKVDIWYQENSQQWSFKTRAGTTIGNLPCSLYRCCNLWGICGHEGLHWRQATRNPKSSLGGPAHFGSSSSDTSTMSGTNWWVVPGVFEQGNQHCVGPQIFRAVWK